VTEDFPVLSAAGATPRTSLDHWSLTTSGEVDAPRQRAWDEFLALPSETVTVDIHCVTKRSTLDTTWRGVPVDARAKWLRGLTLTADDQPGFWEAYGYHNYGDPWQEQRYRGD
jgi:DMSO/TMAO reductase YedYZ molybdopterin-dependent catalytic subunit